MLGDRALKVPDVNGKRALCNRGESSELSRGESSECSYMTARTKPHSHVKGTSKAQKHKLRIP